MLRERSMLSLLVFSFVLLTACNQKNVLSNQGESTIDANNKPHSYGGWFCPDNFGGFPPVDIKDLHKVPVVRNRLPTRDEARNGTSLMFVDTAEYPDARPLEMALPKAARIYSSHNEMNELIIVIQAIVVSGDTVVGYRYPNGGNGSAWLRDVSFLSDKEVEEIGPSPFVYLESEIDASKEKIWQAITTTTFAKELGQKFDQKAFFESAWTEGSRAHLSYLSDSGKATGMVSTVWGNPYLQIDYDYNGFHFTEKLLLIEQEDGKTQLHIVSGPYPESFESQQAVWKSWLEEVKEKSEAN